MENRHPDDISREEWEAAAAWWDSRKKIHKPWWVRLRAKIAAWRS